MQTQTIITVGGVRGRHEMPVSRYLIDEPVADFATAHRQAFEAMRKIIEESPRDAVIRFYPTGLTAVTIGAIAAFVSAAMGKHGDGAIGGGWNDYLDAPARRLEIWEWDRDTGDYRCTAVFQQMATQVTGGEMAFHYIAVQI